LLTIPAAQVALGDHADQLTVLRHNQVPDAATPHELPRRVRAFFGPDAFNIRPHDFL
jgi:hypothetical protein